MIKRLARCIREYKWAAILSPLCMTGEVAMESDVEGSNMTNIQVPDGKLAAEA